MTKTLCLVQQGSGEAHGPVKVTHETGSWHPTAEAAARELDELNEQAEEEAAALERVLPDHLR
ncbi:hypothetical protein [Burkholderia pyrrocinia]|uniref:hypothetical protein n=1 Tax=Burkholderia pyrrocinia TaxID=60550 RepID=UPI0010486532|nr:hypothetical protein [Burkholderia pyrrocinia]TDA49049.1 hypothetical protein EVG18_02010 [Burkholderia pyrrocinia]